jgi:hypothetical protein
MIQLCDSWSRSPPDSGGILLEMGVWGSAPWAQRGDTHMVTVPRNGRVTTSPYLDHPPIDSEEESSAVRHEADQPIFC